MSTWKVLSSVPTGSLWKSRKIAVVKKRRCCNRLVDEKVFRCLTPALKLVCHHCLANRHPLEVRSLEDSSLVLLGLRKWKYYQSTGHYPQWKKTTLSFSCCSCLNIGWIRSRNVVREKTFALLQIVYFHFFWRFAFGKNIEDFYLLGWWWSRSELHIHWLSSEILAEAGSQARILHTEVSFWKHTVLNFITVCLQKLSLNWNFAAGSIQGKAQNFPNKLKSLSPFMTLPFC